MNDPLSISKFLRFHLEANGLDFIKVHPLVESSLKEALKDKLGFHWQSTEDGSVLWDRKAWLSSMEYRKEVAKERAEQAREANILKADKSNLDLQSLRRRLMAKHDNKVLVDAIIKGCIGGDLDKMEAGLKQIGLL